MLRHFFNIDDLNFSEFEKLCSQSVCQEDYPFSSGVQKKVVLYDGDKIRSLIDSPKALELKTELHHCLKEGPGLLVIHQAFPNIKAIDRATEVFQEIIIEEKNYWTI